MTTAKCHDLGYAEAARAESAREGKGGESEAREPRRAWQVFGEPVTAGSRRLHYYCAETGEECWRQGSWGKHGTRYHTFRAYGPGRHPETGEVVASEEEFA